MVVSSPPRLYAKDWMEYNTTWFDLNSEGLIFVLQVVSNMILVDLLYIYLFIYLFIYSGYMIHNKHNKHKPNEIHNKKLNSRLKDIQIYHMMYNLNNKTLRTIKSYTCILCRV